MNYKLVKEYFNNLGYELLDKEYKNNKTKLFLKDNYGYYYYTSFNKFQRQKTASKFNKSNPYTIQNIQLWCKVNNKSFELLEGQIYESCHKKLRWKCLSCKEIFEMAWKSIYQHQNCPFCRGLQVGLSNCLATKNPELAKEWHPIKNGDLTPYDVTCGSHKKVWWLCSKGHEWETSILHRNNNCNCPYCAGKLPTKDYNLLAHYPELCKEWDYEKNKKKPEEYTPYSAEKVWWICKNNHSWETNISSRTIRKCGCSYCSGKLATKNYNLLLHNPFLCEEWNYEKNKKRPENYTPFSNKKVWWKCKKCGYEWKASIDKRNGLKRGCPKCNQSYGENKIEDFLTKKNVTDIAQYTFSDCKYKRLLKFDFYLPVYNCCIEYQGEQHYEPVDFASKGEDWANKLFKYNQIKDQIKRDYCKNNNIKLLEIPYWDFDNIEPILIDYLNQLNINIKVS